MELKDATILIVDDEPMLVEIFAEWMHEENCHVLTAGDGAAALQTVLREHVDLIVSDVRMPLMDGVTLLKNLTASSSSQQPKTILISGFTDLEPREAYHLGCEAILQKPILRVQFADAVRRALLPREVRWSEPPAETGLALDVALPSVSAAIQQGRIAFGRGGFCLRCSSPVREGPVRFGLEFETETNSFAGHGVIRWVEPAESVLGIEITGLDESCRGWAMHLIATHAGSSHIPRTTLSAAPTSKAAK